MSPRVRQGIQFIEQNEADGELRVTGDDDAGMLLWAAQWLDEHREYIITGMRFEHPAEPGDEASITATVVISLPLRMQKRASIQRRPPPLSCNPPLSGGVR